MTKWITFCGLGLVITASATAILLDASSPQLISREVPADDAIDRGRQAFVVSCGFCHGTDARGGEGGPDLVRSEMMLNDEDGDLLGPLLEVGRPDEGMPPFQFSESEVADLAGFVRAQAQAVINRGLYEIQNVVTGDADRGRAYFNGEGGCNACHSPTGDLAGVARRFDPPDLMSRFIYPGRGGRGRPAQPRGVQVTLEGGEIIEGTLAYVDDFSVALTNEDGYRSFSRDDATIEIRDPYGAHVDLLTRYTDDNIHDLLTYLVTLQ